MEYILIGIIGYAAVVGVCVALGIAAGDADRRSEELFERLNEKKGENQ